jgi:enolase-phosphatase E1
MAQKNIRAILLDIEGTTTPISFVHEVLFPFSRSHLASYLEQHADSSELRQDLELLAEEHARDVNDGNQPASLVSQYVYWLIDRDRKSPALKSIQGKIWEQGYKDGSLRSPVFEDVVVAMDRWQREGIPISIFSSGSVLAQKLLFEHAEAGDLTRYIDHYFDTGVGKKSESESYQRIAASLSVPANEILFISDVVGELEAASKAGMHTLLCIRPGNPTQTGRERFQSVGSFAEFAWRANDNRVTPGNSIGDPS